MRTFRLRPNSALCRVLTGLLMFGMAVNALANPTGMSVARGVVRAVQNGPQLTVNASANAFINWNSFNIAAGETTTFVQPSANSVVWNRINDQNPSQIFGSLQANGVVVLLNSSGFYFGPNSFVSAAGLVVSTANCVPPENAGGNWEFNGPPPLASIINYGHIQVGNGGSAFLIADKIENHGTIEAPGGSIGLAAGQAVLLSDRPDGRGMSLQVTLPQGSVDNDGKLIADAGTISLNAKVVNQTGIIQANSVREHNGVIELVAADSLTLGDGSQILAQGDATATGSAGGSVTLKSGNQFSDAASSQIITTGGALGGNGGDVEVSAPNILSLDSSMDARAQSGWLGGMFLIDPMNIVLGTSGSGTVPDNGTAAYNDGAGTLSLNVNTAFLNKNFSLITLQATGNITLTSGTTWDLSASTGQTSGQLFLEAGGNIIFGSTASQSSAITDANNWSVTLAAGYDFANDLVQSGVGNIYLSGGSGQTGGGFLKTAAGDITLTAGQGIFVGKGYVNTTAGGNITAHALAGDINTGSLAQGYVFQSSGTPGPAYYANSVLGGMSTVAGGNVSLTAGGNVISLLPGNNGYYYNGSFVSTGGTVGTAGSGAYGPQAGNVTVVAGGNVTGQYLVANGIGSLYAGVVMDAMGNPETDGSGNYVLGTTGSAGTSQSLPNLALSLIKGGWNVKAAQNIILQEVINPNGDFNATSGGALHYFDYAPDAFVNLTAGHLVQLGASSSAIPRADSLRVPVVYAPILNISAGAGGVILTGDSTFNQLILFASPQGSLTINTTDGGSLISNLAPLNGAPQIFSLIVSDSSKKQYNKTTGGIFGLNDHAATPVHLDNPTPISLNIAGDMDLVMLGTPEAAQITVGGNMNNSRFQGMNLSDDPAGNVLVTVRNLDGSLGTATVTPGNTHITVAGAINNRSAFTSVDLNDFAGTAAPELSYLAHAQSGNPSAATLINSFYYNPITGVFTYQNIPGQTLANVLNLLQHLTIQVYINGVPQWTDPDQTIPLTTTVSVINAATALALQTQYNLDNVAGAIPAGIGPPSSAAGYIIGGGGEFNITAHSIELGTTAGIQSEGAGLYSIGADYPLASLFNQGADISVTTTGDLGMYSSSIASLNGGSIYVNAGGSINVGSPDFTVTTSLAHGIFTTSGNDVSVYAGQDINLNGSRIAAYDGGNVTVESFNGDINAGVGGLGGVTLTAFYVNPVTHVLYSTSPTAFGSGILAETFGPRSGSYKAPPAVLGNVLVETPNGNVNANSAGITQLAFNHLDYPNATVAILAGYELHDSSGNAVLASSAATPTIWGSLAAADLTDPPHTVGIVGGTTLKKIQISDTVWSEIASLLNVSPNAGQLIKVNVSGDKAQLEALLLGTGGSFASYNYAGASSPDRVINVKDSGVIAQNATLIASGNIDGAIFAKGNINVAAIATVNVTALAQGQANVSGDSLGTSEIVGIGGIDASGDTSTASLLSNNQISGGTSGQTGFAQGTAANATSQANQSVDVAKTADDGTGDDSEDDKKKKKGITLAQKVSRVTVILPTKTN